MSVCFFVRCKPQGVDAIDLVKSTGRIFIGYAPWRKGGKDSFNLKKMKESIIDISTEELNNLDTAAQSYKRQIKANLNLVREVKDSQRSFVLVPRPESGVCYIGRVEYFELVDQPNWIKYYRDLREKQSSKIKKSKCDVWDDERNHVGDVVQTFYVGNSLKEIPFFAIPAWIRHKLFGRSTTGRIKPVIQGQDPFETINQIYETGSRPINLSSTNNKSEIANRLLDYVTPSIFEHLVCELLRLDRNGEHWLQVGGSGDGGVDGLASDDHGKICGAVQCKLGWCSEKYLFELGREMKKHFSIVSKNMISKNLNIFVFSLYSDIDTISEDGITIYGRNGIVELIYKHKKNSYFAKMFKL